MPIVKTPPALPSPTDAWAAAARLLARWLEDNTRADALLAGLSPALGRGGRARCQHLFFGAVRHLGRIETALRPMLPRPPRAELRAALLLTGFELLESGEDGEGKEAGKTAQIVHHAVGQTKTLASPAEARLVNAVGRKLAAVLAAQVAPPADAPSAELAAWFSHPFWLVERWRKQFGVEVTRALLEWNQRPAPVHARWRDPALPPPPWLKPTAWPGFFEVPPGHWGEIDPLLDAGKIYLQDPGTRLAVELLAPQPGETVLDLCAAPGGKSLLIADALVAAAKGASGVAQAVAMGDGTVDKENVAASPGAGPQAGSTPPASAGRVVALDLAGPRIGRLKENLSRAGGVEVALVLGDALEVGPTVFWEHTLPDAYAAVLLDAPCTNTGVMRHRVDVKWRLQEGDFRKHAAQQLALLHAAARLVAPDGRLVYSTCSIDAEENARVVTAFFESRAGGPFRLERQTVSLPWESGHDGAAAFLLRRV